MAKVEIKRGVLLEKISKVLHDDKSVKFAASVSNAIQIKQNDMKVNADRFFDKSLLSNNSKFENINFNNDKTLKLRM